ncbi:MAG TPA: hypothetical protein VJL81_04845 [Solirubrobacterales bacterium]|nr:hypothetical protein [Solirubrobacterales bacterium]
MKLLKAILLVPVLLALLAGTALAKIAPQHSGVDPSFGRGGTIAVSVPKGFGEGPLQMATAPSGKSYVLDGSLLYAFGANGLPDHGFGDNGHVQVAAAAGETTEVNGLAVDAQGRILASGSVNPTPGVPSAYVPPQPLGYLYLPAPSNAFVIRLLPNGERDPTFGGSGEIDVTVTPAASRSPYTTLHTNTPIVRGDRLAIVGGEQPILGGSYYYHGYICYGGAIEALAFVAPIDPAGPAVQNLAPTTYTEVPQSGISDFATMPGGNLAAVSNSSNGCPPRGAPWTTTLSALTYSGSPVPALDPGRPRLVLSSLVVDAMGRFLGLEMPTESSTTQGWKLDRLLPNGVFDTAFGSNGGVPLKKFGEESVGALVLGAKERPVIAGGDTKFRLVRLGTKGKIDHSFGDHGWVEVGFGPGTKASPAAMTIDAKGRLLVAGRMTSSALKSGEGIGLSRIQPTE